MIKAVSFITAKITCKITFGIGSFLPCKSAMFDLLYITGLGGNTESLKAAVVGGSESSSSSSSSSSSAIKKPVAEESKTSAKGFMCKLLPTTSYSYSSILTSARVGA